MTLLLKPSEVVDKTERAAGAGDGATDEGDVDSVIVGGAKVGALELTGTGVPEGALPPQPITSTTNEATAT